MSWMMIERRQSKNMSLLLYGMKFFKKRNLSNDIIQIRNDRIFLPMCDPRFWG